MTKKQILSADATKWISTVEWTDNGSALCPFCGTTLRLHSVGWGRDKCFQAEECDCSLSLLARAHNQEILEVEAENRRRAEEEREKAARLACLATLGAPVTISAVDLLAMASGRMVRGSAYRDTLEECEKALYYEEGSSIQEKVLAFSRKNGFEDKLTKAIEEYSSFVEACRSNGPLSLEDSVKKAEYILHCLGLSDSYELKSSK